MIKQLNSREKLLAVCVVLCAAGVGFYQFGLPTLTALVGDLQHDIAAAESKTIKSLRLLQKSQSILEEHKRLSALHKVKGTNEEMTSALLSSIESLARNAGVTVTDIKPRPGQEGQAAKEKQTQREYGIELDMEAPMPALFQFLQNLENSPELFRVLKLNIAPKGREGKILRGHLLISRTVWI